MTGETRLTSGFKNEEKDSVMRDRIGFDSDDTRRAFFSAVREASGARSWRALAELLGLRRNYFQNYQYGTLLLPRTLLERMLAFLQKEKQEDFKGKVFAKPRNWGAIKGGEKNYAKNSVAIISRLREGSKKKVDAGGFWWAKKTIDLNVPLSAKLCELIGAIIGDRRVDGYTNHRGKSFYHVQIVGDRRLDMDYLLGTLSPIMNTIFGARPNYYLRKDSQAVNLNVNSKHLFMVLTKRFGFPAGVKTYTVTIPKEIIDSKEEFIFATIRGIFDTDGCVFFDKRSPYKKPYPRITLQIVSGPLFLQLKKILGNYFSLYTHHSPERGTYTLEVYGHEQLSKWMKLIGFSNKRHLNKIEEKYKPAEGIEPSTSSLPMMHSTAELRRQ